MKLTLAAALTGGVLALSACQTSDQDSAANPEVAMAVTDSGQNLGLITAAPVAGWDVYGGDVSDRRPLPAADVLASPERYDGDTVVVEGELSAICAKKGCWMIVKTGDEQLRVRFQDYAFFVPIESAGRTARMEGVFSVTETSVEDLRHYLEDEGKFEEAAAVVEPKREYELLATGVRMKQ